MCQAIGIAIVAVTLWHMLFFQTQLSPAPSACCAFERTYNDTTKCEFVLQTRCCVDFFHLAQAALSQSDQIRECQTSLTWHIPLLHDQLQFSGGLNEQNTTLTHIKADAATSSFHVVTYKSHGSFHHDLSNHTGCTFIFTSVFLDPDDHAATNLEINAMNEILQPCQVAIAFDINAVFAMTKFTRVTNINATHFQVSRVHAPNSS